MKDFLKYKDFEASLLRSEEDDIFYGKVLDVDDSITFEGDDISSLEMAFKEAVEDYLTICVEIGKIVNN